MCSRDTCMEGMKNFFMGFNLKLWWEKGVFKDIFLFLVFNIILLTLDVFLDIKTCGQFFLSGDILWATLNMYMIFNPFILRFISNFVIELKTEESWFAKIKMMFSCDKILEMTMKSSSCLPIVQTIENIRHWQEMKIQKIFLTKAKAIFGIQRKSIINSMFESFAEGAPCLILNLYILCVTGYMSETQIISVVVGVTALSLTAVKIFFLYRSEDEVEVEPGWRLILLTIFPMMINTIASILLWTYISAHMGGYVVIAVLVVFIMNWLSIQFATCCYTKESIPKYNTDTNDVNDSVEDGSEVYDPEKVDDLEEVDDQEEVDDHEEVDHLEEVDDHEDDDDHEEVDDLEEVDDQEEVDDLEEVDHLEKVDHQEEVDDHEVVDDREGECDIDEGVFTFSDLETAMISTLLPCVVGKTRGIYLSQLLSTNISKLVILGCIWFLQWYVPSEHKLTSWSLNAPLLTCVDHMNDTGYVMCTELNITNPNPCICGSLQSCFCGYSCTESQRGEKIR